MVEGQQATVDQALSNFTADPGEHEWVVITDVHVKVAGDTAIVTYLNTDHEVFPDRTLATQIRHVDTFLWQGGRSMVAVTDAGVVPRGPDALPSGSFDSFIGTYCSAGGDSHVISRSSGSYFDTETGDTHAYKVEPTSSESFVVAGDNSRFLFIRDAHGKVIGMIEMLNFVPLMYYKLGD